MEKDKALERRFQQVYVKQPNVEDTVSASVSKCRFDWLRRGGVQLWHPIERIACSQFERAGVPRLQAVASHRQKRIFATRKFGVGLVFCSFQAPAQSVEHGKTACPWSNRLITRGTNCSGRNTVKGV